MFSETEDARAGEIEELKKSYFSRIEHNTPDEIRENPIFDLKNPGAFRLQLTRELVDKWKLREWFATYKKEAMVSTAGIRGAQNVLYPWDTRFPLNEVGVALATVAKALVLKEDITNRTIHKICSGEVRYNTDAYIEIISRIQAAQGIITHLPASGRTSIWMLSFLIFKNDFDGGEYVTSSHSMSSKIATKDLDSQGSQFIPEMSMRFVTKIDELLTKAENEGLMIELSAKKTKFIVKDVDGIPLYLDYLKKGVATQDGMKLVKEQIGQGIEIMYETVGGCMHDIMDRLYTELGINDAFVWNNAKEDPFFHGLGKCMFNPVTRKKEFFDYGCDTTIREVELSMGYGQLLKYKPIGYPIIMTDPDGDRMVLGQIESRDNQEKLDDLGISHYELDGKRLFAYYMPNQSFFLVMNYQAEKLKKEGIFDEHPRFIITTTPSAATWVEWAGRNDVSAVNVPVGFKEIATIMKKVEKQMEEKPYENVRVHDIYGDLIDLGVQPRMLFAGEESGGMITGPEEPILSEAGRFAIAMREKSAAEASIICTEMFAMLHKRKILLSDYLDEVFRKHRIQWKYDLRLDRRFYNEANPDPESFKKEKADGEAMRDKIDDFFLAIALGVRQKSLTLAQATEILADAFPKLDFSDIESIHFVGDGTYLRFTDKYAEIRKSGTDAIIKCYAAGTSKKECTRYATVLLGFDGQLTELFRKYVPMKLYRNCRQLAAGILREFQTAS